MNQLVGLLQAGMRQIDAAEQMDVSQSIMSRLWRRFRESGSPAENHPGRGRCTKALQDIFFILTARRKPTITAPELLAKLILILGGHLDAHLFLEAIALQDSNLAAPKNSRNEMQMNGLQFYSRMIQHLNFIQILIKQEYGDDLEMQNA
ncbi:hypothetical protein JTB14_000758 [Gonioctena quinquepunctata]|nr:hypothetical protein JTB14_000758 [Gonioctena quinquepunctata]